MHAQERDVLWRFILFIDEVYDAGVQMMWTSECYSAALFEDVLYWLNDASAAASIPREEIFEDDTAGNIRGASPSATTKIRQSHTSSERKPAEESGAIQQKPPSTNNEVSSINIKAGEAASFRSLRVACKRALSRLNELNYRQDVEDVN
jgi:predicted ATPase